MEWIDEVRAKAKRKNSVLFTRDSEFLADLAGLLREQDRRVAVLWALDLAEESVDLLEQALPQEPRPREALEAARAWSAGAIKMPLAQRKILDCHALAKELDDAESIALCHAVGQACAVVHTAGHTLGYPMYDLTATVHRFGLNDCLAPVESRKQEYIDRLLYWHGHVDDHRGPWASFILKAQCPLAVQE